MRKIFSILYKISYISFLIAAAYLLINSALDIYNNFAYDRAILKETPYGYTPLLASPNNYTSSEKKILSGEYVYVEDWLSAYNSKVVFAKVKSKLSEGYINKELLVQTNLNVRPVVSILLLSLILTYSTRKLFHKFLSKT